MGTVDYTTLLSDHQLANCRELWQEAGCPGSFNEACKRMAVQIARDCKVIAHMVVNSYTLQAICLRYYEQHTKTLDNQRAHRRKAQAVRQARKRAKRLLREVAA